MAGISTVIAFWSQGFSREGAEKHHPEVHTAFSHRMRGAHLSPVCPYNLGSQLYRNGGFQKYSYDLPPIRIPIQFMEVCIPNSNNFQLLNSNNSPGRHQGLAALPCAETLGDQPERRGPGGAVPGRFVPGRAGLSQTPQAATPSLHKGQAICRSSKVG